MRMLPNIMHSYRTVRRTIALGALLLAAAAGSAAAAPADVAWTAVANASAAGGTLKKTAGCSGCPDAGAVSQQKFTTGSVTFTVAPGYSVVAGLGRNAASSQGYAIDYAFKFQGGKYWEVREAGVYRTEGAYAATDVFTVSASTFTEKVPLMTSAPFLYASRL